VIAASKDEGNSA